MEVITKKRKGKKAPSRSKPSNSREIAADLEDYDIEDESILEDVGDVAGLEDFGWEVQADLIPSDRGSDPIQSDVVQPYLSPMLICGLYRVIHL